MRKDIHLLIYEKFNNEKNRRIFTLIDKVSAGYIFISFPAFLLYMTLKDKSIPCALILSTLIPFILVSIFRKLVNRERPYEKYDIEPIIPKDTKGKSFPSRHVFSAFLIAAAIFPYSHIYSLSVFILSVFIMIIRVIGTVHFISDVLFGAAAGIILGLIPRLF